MAGRKAGEPRKDAHRKVDGVPAAKPGPPPWEPDAKQVETIRSLAARGLAETQIAIMVGIGVDTLKARAQAVIDEGRAQGIATIAGVLFTEAKKGSYKHAALFLQHVGKWSTREKVEHTGNEGGPIAYTILTGVPVPESEGE